MEAILHRNLYTGNYKQRTVYGWLHVLHPRGVIPDNIGMLETGKNFDFAKNLQHMIINTRN